MPPKAESGTLKAGANTPVTQGLRAVFPPSSPTSRQMIGSPLPPAVLSRPKLQLNEGLMTAHVHGGHPRK